MPTQSFPAIIVPETSESPAVNITPAQIDTIISALTEQLTIEAFQEVHRSTSSSHRKSHVGRFLDREAGISSHYEGYPSLSNYGKSR